MLDSLTILKREFPREEKGTFKTGAMARPLRQEFEGAIYHLLGRRSRPGNNLRQRALERLVRGAAGAIARRLMWRSSNKIGWPGLSVCLVLQSATPVRNEAACDN